MLAVSAQEQLFIYLLNRARANPVAYQQEAGLSVDLSGVAARPPLAVNDDLSDSAQYHSDDMRAGRTTPIISNRWWPARSSTTPPRR
jgi:hypothetical protein